jgi:hypothetical protein
MNKHARLSLYLAGLAILALPATAGATPFTWTGFYIGGNAGVGFGGDSKSVDLEGFNYFAANPAPGEVTKVPDDAAFIGGVRSGTTMASIISSWALKPIFQGSISRRPKFPPVQGQIGGPTPGLAWR